MRADTSVIDEARHVRLRSIPIEEVRPSPENDRIYGPVNPGDPDILALAKSISEFGVKEPLLITLDGYIISGHRRRCAAEQAGLVALPCITEPIRRMDDIDEFTALLVHCNKQREKTIDQKVREEVVCADPEEAYEALIAHRRLKAQVNVDTIAIVGTKRRKEISKAKQPFLGAIQRVLELQRDYWPLSDRRVHYGLLNDPPFRHASKPKSIYANDDGSYKDLTDLLTRARVAGLIPWDAIADDTRPVVTWNVWRSAGDFIRKELADLFKGYFRDLQRSQPNHIEIIGEKSTLNGTIRPVAAEYTIPMTLGRGYCSLPPRRAIEQRFRKSGKEKLILLMLADHDPDGQEIAHSFARSLRDDFAIKDIVPIRVALNAEHVTRFNLPKKMTAKKSSAHHAKFVKAHGRNVWELEAMSPDQLQLVLREAIDSVLDRKAFNQELDAEKRDAARLSVIRERVFDALRGIELDE